MWRSADRVSLEKKPCHLPGEVGIAAFRAVAHLVRLDLLVIEDLADGALHQAGQAIGPGRRPVLGEPPRRPYFVPVTELLDLAASHGNQPVSRLHHDHRLTPRTVLERRQHVLCQRPLAAALHRLGMHTQRTTHREERRIVKVANSIRARAIRAAGSVRDRASDRNRDKSLLGIARSMGCNDHHLYHKLELVGSPHS